jgi:hypothetical protein
MALGTLRGEYIRAGLASTAVLPANPAAFFGAANAVAAHGVTVVVVPYIASSGTTTIVVATAADAGEIARRIAVGDRSDQGV